MVISVQTWVPYVLLSISFLLSRFLLSLDSPFSFKRAPLSGGFGGRGRRGPTVGARGKRGGSRRGASVAWRKMKTAARAAVRLSGGGAAGGHGTGALIVSGADGNEWLGRGARVAAIRGVKGGDGGHGDSCGHGFGERRRKEKTATGARGRRRGAGELGSRF